MYDPGTLYSDPILTSLSVGYQDQRLYADRIFPLTPVGTQSGRYRVYDRSDWLIYPSRREPGTVANEVAGAKWSEDTFFTKEHSLQAPVHDEEDQELRSQGGLANAVFGGDLQIDPHRDATELVTRSILLEWEYKVASAVRNTANYAAGHVITVVGEDQWNDKSLVASPLAPYQTISDPVETIADAIRIIYRDTGRYPNTMAIPFDVARVLETHPRVVERFKNFSLMNDEAWRLLSGFDGNVFVVDSKYNQANNVDATEDIVSFWGYDIWIGIVDPQPGQKTKTFGKTFAQTYPDGTIRPTDRWREEPRKSDLVRVSQKYDIKIVSNTAGVLIKNAINDPDIES